jgi:hypothetical protein
LTDSYRPDRRARQSLRGPIAAALILFLVTSAMASAFVAAQCFGTPARVEVGRCPPKNLCDAVWTSPDGYRRTVTLWGAMAKDSGHTVDAHVLGTQATMDGLSPNAAVWIIPLITGSLTVGFILLDRKEQKRRHHRQPRDRH